MGMRTIALACACALAGCGDNEPLYTTSYSGSARCTAPALAPPNYYIDGTKECRLDVTGIDHASRFGLPMSWGPFTNDGFPIEAISEEPDGLHVWPIGRMRDDHGLAGIVLVMGDVTAPVGDEAPAEPPVDQWECLWVRCTIVD